MCELGVALQCCCLNNLGKLKQGIVGIHKLEIDIRRHNGTGSFKNKGKGFFKNELKNQICFYLKWRIEFGLKLVKMFSQC